jgi:hypothetical protein
MGGIATTPLTRRRFQQQHTGPGLTRHQRGAQGRIAATNDKNINHPEETPSTEQASTLPRHAHEVRIS